MPLAPSPPAARRAARGLWAALALVWAPLAAAQPLAFGSSDDLFERGGGGDRPDGAELAVWVGPAYLDAWRGGLGARLDAGQGRASLGLEDSVHPAAGGLYDPELDEPYDLARALRYLRLNPTAQRRVYARLGPAERVTLGEGSLVRGFSTTAAPDESTVGLEAAAEVGRVRVAGFASDVRLRGVVGAEVNARTRLGLGPLGDLGVGAAVVHDLDGPFSGDSSLTGVELSVRAELVDDPAFSVGPYAHATTLLGRGRALGGGLEARAPNLGNAARARARVGVVVHGAGFQTGAVGPLYAVQNERDRIVVADAYYDDVPGVVAAGTPLDSARAGVDVVFDLRILAFGRAELMQHLRRHIGPDRGSAYGARLAVRGPGDSRLELGVERQGFRGVFALFGSLGEQNRLTLDLEAPIGAARVFVRSRYGYRLLRDDRPLFDGAPTVGEDRYLVERRFEPFVGVRFDGF